MTPLQNERGQISIFFSASLVVMITIVAFTINVGLFVKAKINLQNATDSAAFAGAAVQSRQLTKIAYLNWEMRNIYKEWMYKYYVIGNLNNQNVENPSTITGDVMDFRLRPDKNVLVPTDVTEDPFNIPIVCVHISGSQTNICKRYSIPGLPEFGASNLPGAEEASRAFTDTLIATKVNDCVDRTRLNMLVANTWTYNVLGSSMDQSLAGRAPAILADRQGAWPQAVELALRIRNLEYVMNREAYKGKICNAGTTEAGLTGCTTSINDISQENKLGNERIVKAYYSAYRNLGNDTDYEMKASFTLTEIPPTPVKYDNKKNASNLLINNIYEKQWVDLKLMMANYAIFYAAMIPRADTKTSGACDVSKVAIPVPGYPIGFYKDPDVVTYYAVRGEAEFTGMFNPFQQQAVKLTAYSAAKPFGGRIGPMLFVQPTGEYFVGRKQDNSKARSVPYITSYDFTGATLRGGQKYEVSSGFVPGLPLPANSNAAPGSFWLETEDSALGGILPDPSAVQFGVPNLPYDFTAGYTSDGYTFADAKINKIRASDTTTERAIGLFSKNQFTRFRGNNLTPSISPQMLDQEIARVRAPTLYEAANYLIPTPNLFNMSLGYDSFGFFSGEPEKLQNGYERYSADIYAPLFKGANDQQDLLYNGPGDVLSAITGFLAQQEAGIMKYKMALNRAAISVWQQKNKLAGEAVNAGPGFERAARGISDIPSLSAGAGANLQETPTCASIAGQFLAFYAEGVMGAHTPVNNSGCPKSLLSLFQEYFAQSPGNAGYDPLYYKMKLSWPSSISAEQGKKFMTAYAPGALTGSGQDGVFRNPIPGMESNIDVMHRNFYSTKFIPLDSLLMQGGYSQNTTTFPIYTEGSHNVSSLEDTKQKDFRNVLNTGEVGADISTIKY